MAEIEVDRLPSEQTSDAFRVIVTEGDSTSEHRVTISAPSPEAAARYTSLEGYVRACFEFLLSREPKESILSSFEIREIGRYFPQWESSLGEG